MISERNLALTAASTMALLLCWSAPAAGQVCSTSCSRYEEGECVEYEQTCTSEPSAPQASYGAIAFGKKSGAWGYSYGWNSRAKAEAVAMQNCAQNGHDCESIVWFDRKCGAVAARGDHKYVYWGLGNNARTAQNVALNECRKDRGPSCAVKVSQCSR